MNIILWILFGLILLILLLAFIVRAFVSGQIWSLIKFVIILGIILTIYYYLSIYLYGIYLNIIPAKPKNKNMEVWDNFWYAILIIFLSLLCTVFIKSIKKNDLQIALLFNTFAAFIALIMFTIMYYLYVYYEYIGKITLIATCAMFIGTIIVLIIKFLNISYGIVYPLFIIYSFICLVFLMTFFLFTFSILSKTYDFLT